MGIFASDIPKGITKNELVLVRGELMKDRFGEIGQKLTEDQVDAVMDMLEVAAGNADSFAEREHNLAQVDEGEVRTIENRIKGKHGISFTPAQQAHVHAVLKKYVDQNIVRRTLGIF